MGKGMIFTDAELQEVINEAKEVIFSDQKKIVVNHSAEYNANLKQGADSEALILKPRMADK
jgi:hypothetical protein